MTARLPLLIPALALVAAVSLGCTSQDIATQTQDVTTETQDVAKEEGALKAALAQVIYDENGEPAGLHRFHRWSDRIFQGAQPEGDVAFRNLAAMGVTTVLSVDGARPDLESAHKHGLRYVHVPIEYSGLTREQELTIVKVVAASEGPTFVHCHHGKHRGPAATMIARMALEKIDVATAVDGLRSSECSAKYKGLYAAVESFALPTDAELAEITDDFPSYVAAPALIDAMVDVDFRVENLRQSRDAGWCTPSDNPDVSPPHEARMLWEHYREIGRSDEAKELGEHFVALLAESEAAAIDLEEALRSANQDAAESAWTHVRDGCNTCHTDFRNNR